MKSIQLFRSGFIAQSILLIANLTGCGEGDSNPRSLAAGLQVVGNVKPAQLSEQERQATLVSFLAGGFAIHVPEKYFLAFNPAHTSPSSKSFTHTEDLAISESCSDNQGTIQTTGKITGSSTGSPQSKRIQHRSDMEVRSTTSNCRLDLRALEIEEGEVYHFSANVSVIGSNEINAQPAKIRRSTTWNFFEWDKVGTDFESILRGQLNGEMTIEELNMKVKFNGLTIGTTISDELINEYKQIELDPLSDDERAQSQKELFRENTSCSGSIEFNGRKIDCREFFAALLENF